MKTPMQELLEWHRKSMRSYSETNKMIEVLLSKEKEVVNQAYKQGSIDKKSGRFIVDYYESLNPKEN